MSKKIYIDNKNYNQFLKSIVYYKNKKNDYSFEYGKDFKHKEECETILKALNIKNKKDRLSYVYDVVCDYLDNLFIEKNMCEFKNGKCYSNRCKSFEKVNGCCSNNKNINCKYFEKDHCTIKCSGCKFYICPNLKKKNGPIKMKDIPITYLLSPRQKIVLRYTVFTPKEEIIDKMLKIRI